MKTDKTTWASRIQNLINRRKTGVRDNAKCDNIVADYARHMRSIHLYESLLDVGCGAQSIRAVLPPGVRYTGMDAFPCTDDTIAMQIEECTLDDKSYDTVIGFAMLDGSQDLVKATAQMKRLARKNVAFLTGIGIEPDEFHTFKIEEQQLDELMRPWVPVMKNYLTPKVLLVEYMPPHD